MGVRTHSCDVVIGETIARELSDNVAVDVSAQAYLYSGRIFHRDGSNYAILGSTAGCPLPLVAYRGVECSDVAGAAAISSNMTGDVLGATAGIGTIRGIPIRDGVQIDTTEYTGDLTWAKGQLLACAAWGGAAYIGMFTNCTAGAAIAEGTDDLVGVVVETARLIHGRNQIRVALRAPRY